MRRVSRGHDARQQPSTVSGHTGSVPAGRQQLGHRSHDAVDGGRGRHSAGGRRVRQAQPHAHRQGRRQGSLVRSAVRHTVVLSDHVRARP